MSDLKFILPVVLLLLIITFITTNHDKETINYNDKIDSLERVIADKESDIEFLHNEIEMRESEISYLGHSLDSVKYNIKP